MHSSVASSAPLLGSTVCAIFGLLLTGSDPSPRNLFCFGIGGFLLAFLGGTIIWVAGRRTPGDLHADRPPSLHTSSGDQRSVRSPRLASFGLLALGLFILTFNHAWVHVFHEMFFKLIMVGSIAVAVGIMGCLAPSAFLAHIQTKQLPLSSQLILGMVVLGGLWLGHYLAFVFYR